MANQVVIPFPQQRHTLKLSPGQRRRVKMLAQLSTARGVVRAVIDTLSYVGDARVKRPFVAAASLPSTK